MKVAKVMNMLDVSARAVLFLLYLVGLMSLILFFLFVFCIVLFVVSDAKHPGAIAFTPLWIFSLGFLVFLRKTRMVKETLGSVVDYIERMARRIG